jgi:hypothetical protein
MTLASRKTRGMATQALIASDLVKENIFPFATDAGPGRPGKDILGTPGVSIEVKARSSFSPVADLRQATNNAAEGEIPIVVVRMNGQGPAHIDDWVAFTTWKEMKEFIKWKSGNA